jgi:hypothetical protein
MDISRKIIFLALFFFLALFSTNALAKDFAHIWEFEGEADAGGFRVERGTLESKDGSLEIKNGSFPVIYSPERLNVPSEECVFYLRLKSEKPGVAILSLFSAHTNFAYTLSFRVHASSDYRDYRVYFKDRIASGDYIYDFAMKLPGNNLRVSIDSIGFYKPTRMEVVSILWEDFWEAEPIEVGTSNRVSSPGFGSVNFLTILYIITPIFFLFTLAILYLVSRRMNRAALLNALIISFALSAFLFTLRMDYNWLSTWSVDRASLKGLDSGERIRALNYGNYDSYFDFIDGVRATVPEGAKVRPAARLVNDYSDHVARSVSYYLLPVKSAPKAKFVWLYFDEIDRGIIYDPELKALKRGKRGYVWRVKPVKLFGSDGALYGPLDWEEEEAKP